MLNAIYGTEDWMGAPSYNGALGKANRCFATQTAGPSAVHLVILAPDATNANGLGETVTYTRDPTSP